MLGPITKVFNSIVYRKFNRELWDQITKLQDPSEEVRSKAANSLENMAARETMRAKVKNAVPALIKTLKDSSPKVRYEAANALRTIGSYAKDAIPALTESLKDKDEHVRAITALALGYVEHPITSVPKLIPLLNDPSPGVRVLTIVALKELQKFAKDAVPILKTLALNDPDNQVKYWAEIALGKIDPPQVDEVTLIIKSR